MITWGVVGNSHDASLGVFKGNELRWAALAKDFSGIPNDPHLNSKLVKYAFDISGAGPSQIVWYERPLLKTLRQWRAGQGWLWKENNIRRYLKNYIGYNLPIKYTQHHHSHAAYAYYTQPHDDCAVICLDSIGEFETLTIWHGKNNRLKKIHSQGYPHSLGLFYSAMTQRMGLVAQRDEYLVAQWAQQGNADRLTDLMLSEIVKMDKTQKILMRENLHRGCMWWRPELKTQQDMYDIAAATQRIFEQALDKLSRWAKQHTGSEHLALAGGGALNRTAVDLIRPQWRSVWVPKNPGDPGSCIGAVLAQTCATVEENLDNIWYKKV